MVVVRGGLSAYAYASHSASQLWQLKVAAAVRRFGWSIVDSYHLLCNIRDREVAWSSDASDAPQSAICNQLLSPQLSPLTGMRNTAVLYS